MNEASRALLVYGYQPSGHSAAAFAIEEAGRKAGFAFSSINIAADHHPAAGSAIAQGYHGLLRAAPGLYGALYRGPWARSVLKAVRGAYLSLGGARRLRKGVRRSGAAVVVCPQAAVAAVLAEARRRGDLEIPVVSVLTDYGAHPFWADPPADLILAPDEVAVAALAAHGVPRSRLRATGIPVSPAFAERLPREQARRFLALPPSAPAALLSGGGKGLGGLDRLALALLSASPRAHLLVLCGANDRVRAALCAHRESGARLRVFGPQPSELVAAMMAAADLHVGKPGGLSAAESLASGLPMVLTEPLPGQEEANARFLLGAGAAIDGGSPERAARAAAALLLDRAALAELSERARAAGRPGAADDAVSEIAALLASQRGGSAAAGVSPG
ncbi:MAG: glycosyltransferase [Elusimicrobiota bacterium]|nr:glycosyltransferase [Elusimicrobiota bacterium]